MMSRWLDFSPANIYPFRKRKKTPVKFWHTTISLFWHILWERSHYLKRVVIIFFFSEKIFTVVLATVCRFSVLMAVVNVHQDDVSISFRCRGLPPSVENTANSKIRFNLPPYYFEVVASRMRGCLGVYRWLVFKLYPLCLTVAFMLLL